MVFYHDIYGRYSIEDHDNQVEAEQTRGTDSWLSRAQDLKTCSRQQQQKEVGSWMTIIHNITIIIVL